MILEVKDHEVLSVETIKTETQTATVKKQHCLYRKIKTEGQVNSINLNQPIEIRLTWQIFDLDTMEYRDDLTNTDPFMLDVSGRADTLEPVNGTESIIFSSGDTKTHVIKTTNPLVDNTRLEVLVNA